MLLLEVGEKEKNEYNNFVAAKTSGSFLQSWEWGEWQEGLGRKIFRYWILDDIGDMAASILLVKMSLWRKKYYLYSPYGPVIGESDESTVAKAVADLQSANRKIGSQILQELHNKFADAIFIRIEPKSVLLPTTNYSLLTKSPNIQPAKTLVLNLEKSELELLAAMHNKTRYNIKVAQKHGVEIKDEFEITNGHGLFFGEAIKLISQTASRQKFNTFPASYYKQMADKFTLANQSAVKLHIYKAIFQNQLLATAFMVDFGKTRTFLFGGSSEFHKNVMAPYLLHWQAMLDAKKTGMNVYDFWGIETSSGETPGFVRFKMGFAPDSVDGIKEYAGAYDYIINKPIYKLYGAFRKLNSIKRKILS